MALSLWRDYLDDRLLPHLWCPGCGNGIILGAMARALAALELPRNKVVTVTGIGCSGKTDDYLSTNALHGTHGRALPFATGVKAARPELTVIVPMGDGDAATIGGNHLIHAARRNIDLTAIVFNNQNYGMTGGQVSAATPMLAATSTTSHGNPERGFDLCRVVESAGAVFVARATVYHVRLMEGLIREGIQKKGFSFIEVMSPCPTHFGRRNKLGTAVDMMNDLKSRAIRIKGDRSKQEQLRQDAFTIGKLSEIDAPDFNSGYEAMRARALKGK